MKVHLVMIMATTVGIITTVTGFNLLFIRPPIEAGNSVFVEVRPLEYYEQQEVLHLDATKGTAPGYIGIPIDPPHTIDEAAEIKYLIHHVQRQLEVVDKKVEDIEEELGNYEAKRGPMSQTKEG